MTKKFKAGDKIKIDVSSSAYHQTQGIREVDAVFVEYLSNKKVVVRRAHPFQVGRELEEIRELLEILEA
jgi:siroheme synthase